MRLPSLLEVRADTQRLGQRLLARMMGNLLARQGATELSRVERKVAVAGRDHPTCPHYGFNAIDQRAFYGPKCGMRMAGN